MYRKGIMLEAKNILCFHNSMLKNKKNLVKKWRKKSLQKNGKQ